MPPATIPQLDLLERLLTEHTYPPQWRQALDERRAAGLTKTAASNAIDYLLKQPRVDGRPGPPPTPKQADLIARLLEEKEIPDHKAELVALIREATRRDLLTSQQVSFAIDQLLPLPDKPQPPHDNDGALPTVPDGRYALGTVDDHTLYNLHTTARGWVYVDTIGANEAREPVRGAERRRVLEAIAADTRAAAILYAEVTDRCFRCDRFLTHAKSRISKVGKTCAGYIGVTWGEPPGRAAPTPTPDPVPAPAAPPTAPRQPRLFDLGL